MNIKKILLFLLFAFSISWSSAGILYLAGIKYGSGISLVVVAVFYMMAPAAAAIIVHKGIYKQPVKSLGLDFRKTKWKAFLWIPLVQVLLCLLYVGVVLLFGNAMHISGFGFYSFDQGLFDARMQEMMMQSGVSSVPKIPIPPAALLGITVIASVFIGGLVNSIFTFGEELGWRGFLYNETRSLGFWKSNLLIGTIWGLWHAPIILQGHNYPDHPFAGVFLMVPLSISMGFIMSWMRAKTNSVIAPALFHGMINAAGSGLLMLCYEYTDLVGSIAGIAGIITCMLIVVLIWIFDRNTLKTPEEAIGVPST
ncbi:MAG: Abortive infection protein [Bacteroidetes bacterium]|nr:Abortive infection protein [Bacteroidota bacterium]